MVNESTTPEWLLFDLGGVLVEFSGIRDVVSLLGGDMAEAEVRERWSRCPHTRAFELGSISPDVFAARFIRDWRVQVPPERFLSEYRSWTRRLLPGAADLLTSGAVGGGCAFHFDGRVPLSGRVMQRVAVPLYRMLGIASGSVIFCTRHAFDRAGGFDEALFAGEELAMSRALHGQGRFVVLRESVTTSGRQVRAYSAREILGTLGRMAVRPRTYLHQRSALWYEGRRPDPEPPKDMP